MDIQTRLGMQVLKIWTQLCGPTNRKICKQNKSSWNSKIDEQKKHQNRNIRPSVNLLNSVTQYGRT